MKRLIETGLFAMTLAATSTGPASAQDLLTVEQVIALARVGVETVDSAYLRQRLAENPGLLLLDVRTRREFDAGHISKATWMERGIVEFRMARLERDADREIIVYCAVGNRSALVTKALRAQGYRNVVALDGFNDWLEAGLPYENFLGQAVMANRREINAAEPAGE
ncbi:rhodanese-like domain-containing protein [Parasphingorhabdus sp.]|uniref:rhodanese-like domain-containing protein n=1 Tax=Parasphingorhabdus sp. TaxID=2709688 RepID=UPI002B273D5B|nr:rhodanese-like domain-containing protein [Parasphingorhabdus sp.]